MAQSRGKWVGIVMAALGGVATRAHADEAKPPPLPSHVDVCLVGAVLSPGKADGTAWDGPGKLSADQRRAFDEAMDTAAKGLALANPPAAVVAQVAKVLQGPVLAALEKPEVYGTAWIAPEGTFNDKAGRKISRVESTMPGFGATSTCFKQVKLGSQLALKVELKDQDLVNDDPIGVAMVNAKAIEAAARAAEPFPVHVGDQLPGQIKFLTLLVTKAEPPKPAAQPPAEPAPKPAKKVKLKKVKR